MPVDYYVYDGDDGSNTDARRPSTDDVGGNGLEDFPGEAPDPRYAVNGEAENQRNNCIAGHARTQASIILSVRFSSGNPFIYKQTNVASSPIAVTDTDNGVGDVSLTWPAGAVPPALVEPTATVNGSTPGIATTEIIANGVRVRVFDLAGDAADLPFTVSYT